MYPPCLTSSSIESNNYQIEVSLASRYLPKIFPAQRPFPDVTLPLFQPKWAHLIFINNPTLKLLIEPIMAPPLLDNFIYRQMRQARILCQSLAMSRLANTWSAGDYDVWLSPHCAIFCNSSVEWSQIRFSRLSCGKIFVLQNRRGGSLLSR